MKVMRGFFGGLEGGEGAGKGTQNERLCNHLRQLGINFITVREPGGTAISEQIRRLLLDPENENFSPRAELMLYGAARAQIVDEVIEPALASGTSVIYDRFYDSTTAYQGFGRGLNMGFVAAMKRFATNGLVPDLTVYLDIDPIVALARATKEGADRIEREGIEFHQKLREGYLWIASKEPKRFKVINASGTPDEVETLVWEHFGPLIMKGK